MRTKFKPLKTCIAGAVALGASAAWPRPWPDDVIVGLITKTEGNPFFVKMREGAQEKAKELGIELQTYAGKYDGDNEGQVAAVEGLIAAGAKGFAIVPSDSSAMVPTDQEGARRRPDGDRARYAARPDRRRRLPPSPPTTRKAGELIGEWAAKRPWATTAANAKIAMLDLAVNQPTVDYLRDQGFMQGFGIDVMDPNHYGDESDARICGHEMTGGAEDGGRTAMETLLQKCPDINLVYTINEPAAAGAWEALKAVGKDDGSVLVVSIDGGCPGVKNVAGRHHRRHLAAISAQDGVDGARCDRVGKTAGQPSRRPGLDFFDTGAQLITAKPVDGVPSISVEEGLKLCWG